MAGRYAASSAFIAAPLHVVVNFPRVSESTFGERLSALADLPVGIGIAVGPAILAKGVSEDNIAVRGAATNLAARLQAAAGSGEIVLSEEAHRRVVG